MEQLTAKLVETNLDSVATEENTVIVTAKAGLAAAISEKGIATNKTDSFQQMSKNIDKIKTTGGGSHASQYYIANKVISNNNIIVTIE